MVIEIVSRGAWRLPRVRVWPGTVRRRIDVLAPPQTELFAAKHENDVFRSSVASRRKVDISSVR